MKKTLTEHYIKLSAIIISLLMGLGGFALGLIIITEGLFVIGILVMIISIILSFIMYLLMYGYGELIESNKKILESNKEIINILAKNTMPISGEISNKKLIERAKSANYSDTKKETYSSQNKQEYWTCTCGCVNDPQATHCDSCFQKRN